MELNARSKEQSESAFHSEIHFSKVDGVSYLLVLFTNQKGIKFEPTGVLEILLTTIIIIFL